MFRLIAAQNAARYTSVPLTAKHLLRPIIVNHYRLNSTQAPPDAPPTAATSSATVTKRERTPEELAKRATLQKRDDIQRDWDAKVLTYEEFLPKTQNPSPVRLSRFDSFPSSSLHIFWLGYLHHRCPRKGGSYTGHDSQCRQYSSLCSQ